MRDITAVLDQLLWQWYYELNVMLSYGLDVGKASNAVIAELKRRKIWVEI